jgi:glycosyltransferase involved in cell wall biosynthesis
MVDNPGVVGPDDNNQSASRVGLAGPFVVHNGFCYIVALRHLASCADTDGEPRCSRLQLFENDLPLGPAHRPHHEIGAVGGGRFSHWGGNLCFSASDNSDPNTNGCRYSFSLEGPAQYIRVRDEVLRSVYAAVPNEPVPSRDETSIWIAPRQEATWPLKIGLFGNTNNYMFAMAEAFRSLGHEVVLIVTSKELLHRPESLDTEFSSVYPHWVVDASDLEELDYFLLNPNLNSVLDRLACCDALVLNHVGPSLLPMLNRPAIAFLTGADLDYYANPSMVEARTAGWSDYYKESPEGYKHIHILAKFIHRQRLGIQNSVAVRYLTRGLVPLGDRILDELGVGQDRRFFHAIVDARVTRVPAPHNWPIRVFCATRLTWKLPVEPGRSTLDYKGSDIMIRGLGLFYRAFGTRLDIQLVRKGLHVEELKALIVEEGLEDQVTWSDEMSLSEVRARIAESDIIIEQLSDSAIGGAGLDAMATGRPVIGNARGEVLGEVFGDAAPICQAKTPEEVSAQLRRLVFDPEERERVGNAGCQYTEDHCNIVRSAQIFVQYFEDAFSAEHVKDR